MNPLAVLRYCRDVLSERQEHDPWQGWFWGIRCKVLDYWIARLERETEAGATTELTSAEQQEIRSSHPLLMSRAPSSGIAAERDFHWRTELRARVERYLAAVKAHRDSA